MTLNICFSYGGRDDIVMAVQRDRRATDVPPDEVTEEIDRRATSPPRGSPTRTCSSARPATSASRTSCSGSAAYAELYFTDTFWPDFGREDIDIALAEYGRRKRKFGGLLPEDIEAFRD